MGLSAPKQKQRLVGSASTRNAAWLNDSAAPGQRMLAQMGWTAGQSLGSTMQGLTENLKVAYKMDNKGIGAQRHEREARANGKDVWVGGGGDLGSLFERLNAANATPSTSSIAGDASSDKDDSESDAKKRKKDKKSKSKDKDSSRSSKKRKIQEPEAGPSSSVSAAASDADAESSSTHAQKDKKEKEKKKSKKDKEEKSEKKKDKKKRKRDAAEAISDAVATVASADASLSSDKTAVQEIKQDVAQGRPVRMAHRAKFLRAKRMVSANDLASVNEILGIASTPSSSAPGTPRLAGSGTSTPTTTSALASKTYPGPGGAEIALMDVDQRLLNEQTDDDLTDTETDSDSDTEKSASASKKQKKEKKEKKEKKDKKSSSSSKEQKKKEKKAAKEAKKSSKKDKASKKDAASSPSVVVSGTPSDPELAARQQLEAEEKEKSTQIGTNAQGLFVFEYLNRRLMLRKAQIARQKKAEQQAIFTRAATVHA
ncbi:hypothetical protein BCV70DRAFT_198215 [Testicularia cyperi]|uniref:PinX1-related protein 1 n=1 Tax=Testicularia cyperi TaxID=1882483 RepID=A0A317XUF0_9BASI|nr:hypothetical protein BCV70DRAFT_198215 [Testicularia cyperi]